MNKRYEGSVAFIGFNIDAPDEESAKRSIMNICEELYGKSLGFLKPEAHELTMAYSMPMTKPYFIQEINDTGIIALYAKNTDAVNEAKKQAQTDGIKLRKNDKTPPSLKIHEREGFIGWPDTILNNMNIGKYHVEHSEEKNTCSISIIPGDKNVSIKELSELSRRITDAVKDFDGLKIKITVT